MRHPGTYTPARLQGRFSERGCLVRHNIVGIKSKTIAFAAAALLVLLACLSACSNKATLGDTPEAALSTSAEQQTNSALSTDEIIYELFTNQESNVQVRGEGVVVNLLSDDNDGDRHQRFILELMSGQTLLITHNIDIAPRLNGIAVGDHVEFYGEYFYNQQGGGIHWTHHDPDNRHIDGWLLWENTYYK